MPHLLNFLKGNGTLLTNDHTILISHTAGGILASLTGLYPDRNGQTVSNSYDYFKNDGTPQFTSSFKYWTDTVDGTNETMPNMVGDGGQTTPAPWLTYTQAGCNVGGVSSANIVLENNSTTASGDMTRVFGVGSDEWNEAANPATKTQSLDRLRRHRGALRQGQRALRREPEGEARRRDDLSRVGRRLQGALRREVRQPGDHRRAAVRQGNRRHQHHRSGRQLRLPRLRRGAREEHARHGRADAGERRPGHVRLHLGCARQPHAGPRFRPG